MQPYKTLVNSFGHQFSLYNDLTAEYTFSSLEGDSLMSVSLQVALFNPLCIMQVNIKQIFWHTSEEQYEIIFIVGLIFDACHLLALSTVSQLVTFFISGSLCFCLATKIYLVTSQAFI